MAHRHARPAVSGFQLSAVGRRLDGIGVVVRALVFGYHTMGCVGFDALLRHGFRIAAVFTHRNDPAEEIFWESLAERARGCGIPVHFAGRSDPKTPAFAELVAGYRPEFIFSFYFRYMIPESVLRLAPRGAFNLHGSLLPRYRGRAPVNWVLVNGETETGVSLHHMVAMPDAGNLVAQERVEIAFEDTARTLHAKLESAAEKLLDRALPLLKEGRAPSVPMNLAEGSYFGGRTPEDGRFSWEWPALRIYNLLRAVTHPYPGAFTMLAGRKLFVWWAVPQTRPSEAAPGTVLRVAPEGVEVATGDGALLLSRCQLEGEPEADADAFFRAHGITVGSRLDEARENP
jgi:UDP-4-amino-4-deoxy-L-arabinose formyltransferase/UDP-glucuronic acid dehydrogenase (UDP-4-keto-hexauronic acid decarboxylating)